MKYADLEKGKRVRITQEHHPQFLCVGSIHTIEHCPGVIIPEASVVQIALDNGKFAVVFPHEITELEED